MRAAVYARRSTDDHQAASLEVQIAEARRYIASKGWTLDPSHVFVDDGVSRSEFVKRHAFNSLRAAAEARAFDAIVVRDESRLGGDTFRTALAIQEFVEHGVRLFFYFSDDEVTLNSPMQKVVVAVQSAASEMEREKIAGRTLEHLATKARKGLNAGGRVFGYDNVPIMDGARRVAVDYAINEREAEVVREIFRRFAEGQGLRAICKSLNDRGVPSPRAGRRGTRSWCPNGIREMLRRDRYRGILIWGRLGKAYRGGTKVHVARDESEWTRVDRPELRIVDEELWGAVQAKIECLKRITGRIGAKGPPARYMLSGLARCATCGGPIQAVNGRSGRETIKVYVCSWRRVRGAAVCANAIARPVEHVDHAVLSWIRENVLRESLIVETLREVRRRLETRARTADARGPQAEAEIRTLRAEIDRLVSVLAMAGGEQPGAVLRAIGEREKRVATLEADLRASRAAPGALSLEVRRMEREARQRLDDLRGLVDRNPAEARRVLEALLDGPLTFAPLESSEGRRFQIQGSAALGPLFITDSDPNGT
ncbi:MAG: recombinase family protein [Deltaproteobacteria bacterium]|nr:recombinase family protein [Deltaproteobacteria bacterium]